MTFNFSYVYMLIHMDDYTNEMHEMNYIEFIKRDDYIARDGLH